MESSALITRLHRSMAQELEETLDQSGDVHGLVQSGVSLSRYFEKLGANDSYENWSAWWGEYGRLTRLKMNLRNSAENFAARFESRPELLAAMERQESGLGHGTYWDTYEHGGRRRLEAMLAKTYGVGEAVLVNSGMAALVCALESLNLNAGDRILFDSLGYFESRHYLYEFLRPCGIVLEEADLGNQETFQRHLSKTKPRCVLCETSTIGPGNRGVALSPSLIRDYPETRFLVDNSIGSHAIRWFDAFPAPVGNLVVIESGSKTLSEVLMSGVIYGGKPAMERMRDYARSSGMQLQALAFNGFNSGDIRHAAERVEVHGSNVSRFIRALKEGLPDGVALEYSRRPEAFPEPGENALGPLVFLSLPGSAENMAAHLDDLLAAWQETLRHSGIPMPFRCGYGWHSTTARIYAGTGLNRHDAPSYLRLSIGLEPPETIDRLADTFRRSLTRLS